MKKGNYVSGTGRIVNENTVGKILSINEEGTHASVRVKKNEDLPDTVGKKYSVSLESLVLEEAPMVTIELEKIEELVSKFHEVCGLADEMNIYEWEEGDESLQEAKEWVKENF